MKDFGEILGGLFLILGGAWTFDGTIWEVLGWMLVAALAAIYWPVLLFLFLAWYLGLA